VDAASAAGLARLLRRCLREGRTVEIERLGTFRPGSGGQFEFVANRRPSVFLAYVEEDRAAVERLYEALQRAGFDPWMDRRKLMAGQNWPRAIERAIGLADFFVACFSQRAVVKRGTFQSELRYALDCARKTLLDDVFFIPARLDECRVPSRIQRQLQYVDLFPDWSAGVAKLTGTIRCELERRAQERAA
jgi:hypothetical protein